MSYYSQLELSVKNLGVWQRTVLSAMCAESVRPFIVHLARNEVQDLFSQGIELCRADTSAGLYMEIKKLQNKIKKLPEASVDDPYLPEYKAMVALSIVSYAADSVIPVKSEKYAVYAASAAADIYGAVDVVLKNGLGTSIIDPRNPPQPGLLKKSQIEAQFDLIERMSDTESGREAVAGYAQSAANILKQLLEEHIGEYLNIKGWGSR